MSSPNGQIATGGNFTFTQISKCLGYLLGVFSRKGKHQITFLNLDTSIKQFFRYK